MNETRNLKMNKEDRNTHKPTNPAAGGQDAISRRDVLKKSAVVLGASYLAPTTMDVLLAGRATAASVPPGPACPSLTITNNSRQVIEIIWIPCGQSSEQTSLVTAGSSLNGLLNPADTVVDLRQIPASSPPYPCNGSSERATVGSSSGWDSVSWGSASGQCSTGTANRPWSTAMVLTITFIDE